MNILAITSLYPSRFRSQAGLFNAYQLRNLPSHVHCTLIAPIPWTSRLRPASPLSKTAALPEPGPTYSPTFLYPPGFLRSCHGRRFFNSVVDQAEKLLAQIRFDLVYGMFAYPDGWGAAQVAKKWKLPFVLKIHGSDVHQQKKEGQIRRLKEVLTIADGVVAVSENLAHEVRHFSNDMPIHVVRNGVDLDLFSPGSTLEARKRLNLPANAPTVLYVGRLEPVKGADLLPNIAEGLRRETQWVIVGQGSLAKSLKASWPTPNVRFIPELPQTELVHAYRAADVLLVPSRNEGIPNCLMEALACDRPVVASSVGGIPEVVTNTECTVLVPSGDVFAFIEEADRLLSQRPLRGVARALVKNLSWSESGRRLAKVFEKVGGVP